ncbi:SiaB family protein kinase [Roseospirillum parvum]|uniref:Uncharacterized protein n=1 Tax=Roseospirillum parvum TaxID=83401 RepID=A0A1G7WNC0_9PROT|nr:SiaB family protein kinase [Roseospirillum parvum]SDG73442.1 hypothetical protein SAMN05421742_102265 [Roseospirillum parvum]
MWAEEYFRHKLWLNEKGIIFAFTGYLSEELLFSLGDALRKKMALEETDANVAKRVFSVFVEQAQNVIRYSADRVEGETAQSALSGQRVEFSSGLVAVANSENGFSVVCGNVIDAAHVERLRTRLDQLAAMDKNEIRSYYKEKLRAGPDEDSKGASLGLIEIARRSTRPIRYDFIEAAPGQAFYCLEAYV